MSGHFKDLSLEYLAKGGHNVAQFVSFGPDGQQRYARMLDCSPNHPFDDTEAAVDYLLQRSPEGTVNIRSYQPDQPKSNEFIRGLSATADVAAHVRRLGTTGLFTIVNETVSPTDGGVSGVSLGNVVEFSPNDTPRCVERPGTAQLPRAMALGMLATVYGFRPELPHTHDARVEFSLHPLRRGYLHRHTIIWEAERVSNPSSEATITWPHNFSRLIGDKTYGLLVADAVGLPVPHTQVTSRNVAPFSFGRVTGTSERWIRTAPATQTPGQYTTQKGWTDPFVLLQQEDPGNGAIAAVLSQEGVEAQYSGSLITQADGRPLVEGVRGEGDDFMLGTQRREVLPPDVDRMVRRTYEQAAASLGSVGFEWVYDGNQTWVVQLHQGKSASSGAVIFPGQPDQYRTYDAAGGVAGLRELIADIGDTNTGIQVVGDVGITSHIGDVLRKACIPSILSPQTTQ